MGFEFVSIPLILSRFLCTFSLLEQERIHMGISILKSPLNTLMHPGMESIPEQDIEKVYRRATK